MNNNKLEIAIEKFNFSVKRVLIKKSSEYVKLLNIIKYDYLITIINNMGVINCLIGNQ